MIELVVVLVLVGILSVIAIPRLGGTGAFETRGYYDELVTAARYAQKAAVASGCRVRLAVSASGYSAHRDACPAAITNTCTNSGGSWSALPAPSRDGVLGKAAPGGVTLGGAPASLSFCPDGSASAGATFTVSGGGFSGSFSIVAETGYVDANP